jgi:transcription-repair coupling factor (superfamily II helicase)
MSADAEKRLAAIESMEELGAGFTLATHDLEIRGAGELLGDDQSGQIHEIGYTLYTDLLERAVKALKEGRSPNLDQPLHQGPEIDLLAASLLPDDYIADVHTRLVVYKRIAGMETKEALKDLQVELIDRFIGGEQGRILFGSEPDIDTTRLVDLVQKKPDKFRFDGGSTLRVFGDFPTEEERFTIVSDMLALLSGQDNHLTN